jgi:Arc/MetJ-type ribon-helix-helix transcriptional regulator
MANELSPENEAFLADVVARQEFVNRDAALDEAVSLLRHRRRIIEAVAAGVDQLNRGETHRYEHDDLDRFLRDIEARQAQRSPAE